MNKNKVLAAAAGAGLAGWAAWKQFGQFKKELEKSRSSEISRFINACRSLEAQDSKQKQ